MDSHEKLSINTCIFEDLLGLPSMGKVIAYRIWEMRKSMDLIPENLAGIPHIRIEKILHLIDFTTAQEQASSLS